MAIYSSTKEYIGNLNGAAGPILRSLSPIGRMSRNKFNHHLRFVRREAVDPIIRPTF